MKTIKLKIHSIVDLITNSSTVIFTYSDGSVSPLKELVNEMLRTFGKTETFDDIFYADSFLSNSEDYIDFEERYSQNNEIESIFNGSYIENDNKLNEIKLQILKGEIEKPEWMIEVENDYNDYKPSSDLEILVKNEKYQELANKLIRFLYSTDHEAMYN